MKATLADGLYHEIGHHYHKDFTSGIGRNEEECFGENYSNKMMKKSFGRCLAFLSQLSPLIKYLQKR